MTTSAIVAALVDELEGVGARVSAVGWVATGDGWAPVPDDGTHALPPTVPAAAAAHRMLLVHPDGTSAVGAAVDVPVRAVAPCLVSGEVVAVVEVDLPGGADVPTLVAVGDLVEATAGRLRALATAPRVDDRPDPGRSEGFLDDWFTGAAIPMAVVGVADRVVWRANARMGELVVRDADALVGTRLDDWVVVDDRERLRDAMAGAAGPGEGRLLRGVGLRTRGPRPVTTDLHLSGGAVGRGVVVAVVGASARARSRALLEATGRILERVAAHDPLEEVLADLCLAIEDARAGVWCSALLVEDGRLLHVAAPSIPEAYGREVHGMAVGPRAGACGTAAHRAARVPVNDIATDPLFDEWRTLALQLGFRSTCSTPVLDDTGAVVATFASYCSTPRDPTAEELELQDAATHLASVAVGQHRARARLEALTADLESANAGLVRASAAKDEFLSMASHELRTPLTPMAGVIETIQDRWEDLGGDQRTELLGALARQTSRMRHLVDDLLVMSRATRDTPATRVREQVAVAPAVREAVSTLYMGHRDVHVDVPEGLVVVADPLQLHQVLVNFLSNALKYAPTGRLEVRARARDGVVRIEVDDEGPGVPASLAPQVFEPFTQADQGTRRTSTGTGLGLAVVRAIATAHGGRAGHEPLAPGSRFWVELPAPRPGVS